MMSTRAMPSPCGTLNSSFDRHGGVRVAPTLRVMRGFVDIHSHMVPSGDDGVRSVDEAVELVLEAGSRGTAVQYATPHAMERHPFTDERRRRGAGADPGAARGARRFPRWLGNQPGAVVAGRRSALAVDGGTRRLSAGAAAAAHRPPQLGHLRGVRRAHRGGGTGADHGTP